MADTEQQRYDEAIECLGETARDLARAKEQIVALRLRAEKAEAELAQLAARIAEIERKSWGFVASDPDSPYTSFKGWFDDAKRNASWRDRHIVRWLVRSDLGIEHYRIRRHVDTDGCVSYTYEKDTT